MGRPHFQDERDGTGPFGVTFLSAGAFDCRLLFPGARRGLSLDGQESLANGAACR